MAPSLRARHSASDDWEAHHFLVLILVCTVPWLGGYDFYTRGEAREALVVSDVVLRGQWILPRGYDGAIASKPPLFHWLASLFAIGGIGLNELSIRLPSALFGTLCCLTFLLLSRERLISPGRWIFVVFLSFSFEWLRASLTARVDMVHASSLAVALLLGFSAMEREKRCDWAWLASAFAMGLATLGKGPVALALSAACLGTWGLVSRGPSLSWIRPLLACGTLAGLLAAAWYVGAYLQSPDELFSRVWYENVQRLTGTMEDAPHSHSVGYLFGVFLLGLFPWTPILLGAAYRFVRRASRDDLDVRRLSDLSRFSILCISIIFLFYSIPSSKRGVYLLVCYPFVALLVAQLLQDRIGARSLVRFKQIAVLGCVVLLLTNSIVMPAVASNGSERRLSELLRRKIKGEHRVFSFGHEFYGASFYGSIPIWRMENATEMSRATVSPAPNDLLIVGEHELVHAMTDLEQLHLTATEESMVTIKGKTIRIMRLVSRTPASESLT